MTVMTERPDDYEEIRSVMQQLRNEEAEDMRVEIKVEITRPSGPENEDAMYVVTEQSYRDTCKIIDADEKMVQLENENVVLSDGNDETQTINIYDDIRVFPEWPPRNDKWARLNMQEGIISEIELVDH